MPLPLPGANGEAFLKGLNAGSDVGQRVAMNPYDMQLKQSEAYKNQGEGNKTNLITDLMNKVMSGQGNPQDQSMLRMLLGQGEDPNIKRQQDYLFARDASQAENNQKVLNDVKKEMYQAKSTWKGLDRIEEQMKKRPDATGPVQGFLNKNNFSTDKAINNLTAEFGVQVADFSHYLAARTGATTAQIAERYKMSPSAPLEANLGKLQAFRAEVKQNYLIDMQKMKDAGVPKNQIPSFEEWMEIVKNPNGDSQQPQQQPETSNQGMPQQTQTESQPDQQGQVITEDMSKSFNALPPQLRKHAMDAIHAGADPQAVIKQAMMMLFGSKVNTGAR